MASSEIILTCHIVESGEETDIVTFIFVYESVFKKCDEIVYNFLSFASGLKTKLFRIA